MLQEFRERSLIVIKNPSLAKLENTIIKQDYIHWLQNWCVTQDEHDKRFPFKQMPNFKYFKHLIDAAEESEILLIPKARQIMITWLFVSWLTWKTLYHDGLLNMILSKRGPDADVLIKRRANVIYDFIPEPLKPNVTFYRSHNSKLVVEGTQGSEMWALPQGADKIRSNTPSNVLFDEMAFMNEAMETYGAAKPAITGGGHLCGVSTAKRGSYFEELLRMAMAPVLKEVKSEVPFCWHTILELSMKLEAEGKPDILKRPMRGMIDYYSEEENIRVIWVHYTIQKEKSQTIWKKKARKGYNKALWSQEMEINFSIETGKLVFPGFPSRENLIGDFTIPHDWPKGRSLDVGYDKPTACLWFAIEPETGDIYIYREYYTVSESTSTHKKNVLELSLQDLDGEEDVNFIYFLQLIDPQTQANDQAGGAELSSIMDQYMESKEVEIDGKTWDTHIYFTPAGKKPVAGIFRLRDLMKNCRIWFLKSCKLTKIEIENYVDPTDKLDKKLKPDCKNDHLIDCLLFIMEALPPLYGEEKIEADNKGPAGILREMYRKQKYGKDHDETMGDCY